VTTGDLKLMEWMESDTGAGYRAYTFRRADGPPEEVVIDAPAGMFPDLQVSRVYRLTIECVPTPEGQ
jgi:hypothetical protein